MFLRNILFQNFACRLQKGDITLFVAFALYAYPLFGDVGKLDVGKLRNTKPKRIDHHNDKTLIERGMLQSLHDVFV